MTTHLSHDDLVQLVGGLCNGTLRQEEFDCLDQLLLASDAARRFYSEYMFLHAELYAQQTRFMEPHSDLLASIVDGVTAAETMSGREFDEAPHAVQVRSPSHPHRISRSWLQGSGLLLVSIALLLVGVAAVVNWFVSSNGNGREVAQAPGVEGLSPMVARVTATRNCLWGQPNEGVGFGSALHAGQRLRLAAGLAEITFDDGAKVVLEGPALFDVRAPGSAWLHEGRLAAVVPEQARGFAVSTDSVNIVDMGTEFGLKAEPEGLSEIHVFRGFVKAQLLNEYGQQVRSLELNESEAAVFTPASATVAKIPARDDQFVRSLSGASGPHDGLYAYDGFNYPSGPLSEQNGGFGWAGPWFDIAAGGKPEETTNYVDGGSLEYEGMVPQGNRAIQTAQQNRIRRSLSTSIGGVFDTAKLVENQDGVRLVGRDETTVYVSFLQRVDRTGDVFYGLELHRGDGNANRVLCIGNGAEQCGYGVTSNYNVYGLRNFPALGEENTDVNFFVVKIVYGAGNRDRVTVFRNPESLIEESACTVDAELSGNFAFDRISLGDFEGTKVHEVDEIRVGTTFLSVTGRRTRGLDRLMRPVAALEAPIGPPRRLGVVLACINSQPARAVETF